MLIEFKEHIKEEFAYLKESKFLIAVSGGIDSVVLTHLFQELEYDFALCHCNFKLRGEESDKDEQFVKKLAADLNKHCYTTSFDTETYAQEGKLSIQVAARNLRYQWFYELLKENKYDYVLTAHNANDNLETFLINLTRGTGLEGLTGIPPVNDRSIRPLLQFTREQIMMYAIKNEVQWREDKSNTNIKYVRNKVRHQVLPVLREINPHVIETFKNTLKYLNQSQQIVKDRIEEVSKKVLLKEDNLVKINIDKLKKLGHTKAYLYQLLQPYGFTEWNDIFNLLTAQSGKQLFSSSHRLLKDRNYLLLTEIDEKTSYKKPFRITESTTEINKPFHLSIQQSDINTLLNKNSILIDRALIQYPLYVRKWSFGDSLYPTGMKGSKKVSQLFKDRKLSLIQKEKIWLLTNATNEIIWVIGMRQDRRFIATKNTNEVLKISIHP